MTTTATATRAAVLATAVPNQFIATTDQGGRFDVLGPAGPDQIYVQGRMSHNLAVVTRTGNRLTRGQVRVRFDFAFDLGDMEGTLSFDAVRAYGVVPSAAFDL